MAFRGQRRRGRSTARAAAFRSVSGGRAQDGPHDQEPPQANPVSAHPDRGRCVDRRLWILELLLHHLRQRGWREHLRLRGGQRCDRRHTRQPAVPPLHELRSRGTRLVYPQGWARKGSPNDITFSDKDNSVQVQITKGSSPTVSSVTAELKKEATNDPTLQPGQPKQMQLPSGPAIHVVYHVQGPPDPVTGKKPTMMVDRYVLG